MHSACSAILPGATRLESCFIGPAWVYSYLGHWEIHPERRSYLQKWLTARRTMETCQNILIPFASSTSQNKVQEGETHVNINPWYTSIRDILLFNEVLVLSLEKKVPNHFSGARRVPTSSTINCHVLYFSLPSDSTELRRRDRSQVIRTPFIISWIRWRLNNQPLRCNPLYRERSEVGKGFLSSEGTQ